MNYIKAIQHLIRVNIGKRTVASFSFFGLAIALTACSVSAPQPVFQNSAETNHIFTLSLLEGDTPEILEQEYSAKVIVWEAEDGFAILSSSLDKEFLPQSLSLENNKDAIKLPVFANGFDGSAEGKNGWSSGKNGWSSGKNGWSSGKDGWSSGKNGWASGGNNLLSKYLHWENGTNDIYLTQNKAAWEQIDLFTAQAHSEDLGRGVKVAVIDTGIDVNHPMIADNLVSSYYWRDFVDGDKMPLEELDGAGSGHGTAVAGLIIQVAPKAEILPIRVLAKDGVGDMDNVILAIEHAVKSGADIINLSIGSDDNSNSLKQMLLYAKKRGVFVVAAAGNTGTAHNVLYPAKMADSADLKGFVYAVGSVSTNDSISSFSASANRTILFAPGEELRTAFPGNTLTNVSGTSFAAPIFAGSLALVYDELSSSDRKYMHSYVMSGLERERVKSSNSWLYGDGILNVNALNNIVKIENPSFEDELDDWVDSRTETVQEFNGAVYNNGEYLAKVENRGYVYQLFNKLSRDTSYELSFLIGGDHTAGAAEIELKYFDGSKSVEMIYNTTDISSLERIVIPFKTGRYNTYARIKIENDAKQGNIYLDAFRLRALN